MRQLTEVSESGHLERPQATRAGSVQLWPLSWSGSDERNVPGPRDCLRALKVPWFLHRLSQQKDCLCRWGGLPPGGSAAPWSSGALTTTAVPCARQHAALLLQEAVLGNSTSWLTEATSSSFLGYEQVSDDSRPLFQGIPDPPATDDSFSAKLSGLDLPLEPLLHLSDHCPGLQP